MQEAHRIDDFWMIFQEYAIETFEAAVDQAVREFQWFPVPADMIDLCNTEADRKRQLEYYNPNQLEMRKMSKEEAIAAITKITEHVDRPGMNDEEIEADKKKVAERKELLRKQAEIILSGKKGWAGDGETHN